MPNNPPKFGLKPAKTFTPHKPTTRASACKRGYDARWRKRRAYELAHQPLCVACAIGGFLELAAQLDHITPHEGDKTKFWGDTQPLCVACHKIKTAHENSERMRKRAHNGQA